MEKGTAPRIGFTAIRHSLCDEEIEVLRLAIASLFASEVTPRVSDALRA